MGHSKFTILSLFAVLTISGWPHSSLAIEVPQQTADEFLAKSKKEPERLFLYKVSATWCGPCKSLSADLENYKPQPKDALAKAFVASIDFDVLEPAEQEKFIKMLRIPEFDAYPTTFAFKNGKPIGAYVGASLSNFSKFADEAIFVEAPTSTTAESGTRPIRFPCASKSAGSPDQDPCVFGVAGPGQPDTHNFGLENLVKFKDLFGSPEYAKLFAPPVEPFAVKAAKNSPGVFFIENPFLKYQESFQSLPHAKDALSDLSAAPTNDIRMLFTGHGERAGVETDQIYKTSGSSRWTESIYLEDEDLKAAVGKANQAQKNVRGIFVQCYGGQFAAAFMAPKPNTSAKKSCGVFATIPEKLAEGCYPSSYKGERQDYFSWIERLHPCDGKTNALLTHYEIMNQSEGHDIPMLSSDYFLTRGPAAEYLAPDVIPPNTPTSLATSIYSKDAKSGESVSIYFDRVQARARSVAQFASQEIAPPQVEFMGCLDENITYREIPPIDAHKRRVSGKDRIANAVGCLQIVKFSWKQFTSPIVGKMYSLSDVTSHSETSIFPSPARLAIDISSLKTESRLHFGIFEPARYQFIKGSAGAGQFQTDPNYVAKLAQKLSSDLPELSEAITKLQKNGRFDKKWLNLLAANEWNLSAGKVDQANLSIMRLAHLAFVGEAFLALKEKAKTDPKAKELLDRYLELRECEKTIF